MMINQNKAKKIVLLLLALQIASYLIYSLLIFTGKIEEINPALFSAP
jgi:predicted DNA-binding transcriptional regulator